MKLFELVATLALDTSGFNSEVDKATKSGEELGRTLTSAVAKGTAAGQAAYDFTKSTLTNLFDFGQDLVETAAEVEAENAAFEQTFGDMAEAARYAFDLIGNQTGVLSRRLQTVGTKAFAQFVGSGMDASEALGMMGNYLQIAADASAYFDMSLTDVDERLRSFLRGNVEAGDAIYLYTSALQRDTYAMQMYEAEWKDLNELQRQSVMMQVVRDIYAQSEVIGYAAEEADNYQTVLGNLQETWRQIKATLGGPILEALIPVMEKFSQFLQDNPEAVEALANTISTIANVTFDGLMGLMTYLEQHGPELAETLESIAGAISTVAGWFGLDFSMPQPTLEGQGLDKISTYGGDPYLWRLKHDAVDKSGRSLYDYMENSAPEGTAGAATDYQQMGSAIAAAIAPELAAAVGPEVASALNGVSVKMDGRVVGQIVSTEIQKATVTAAKTSARRFSV